MSDSLTATALTVDTKHGVNQPSFTLGAAQRTTGDSTEDAGDTAVGQDAGDTVVFSQQGRLMAARQAQTQESSEEDSDEEAHIRQLKERIAKLQEEIQQIQQDQTLDDDEKRQQLMAKQSELAEMQTQLNDAYEEQAKASSSAGQSANMTSLGSYGAKS